MAANSNSNPDTEMISNVECSKSELPTESPSSCASSSEAETYGVCPLLLQNLTEMGVAFNLAVRVSLVCRICK